MNFVKFIFYLILKTILFFTLTIILYLSLFQQRFPPSIEQAKNHFLLIQKMLKLNQQLISSSGEKGEMSVKDFLKQRNQKINELVDQELKPEVQTAKINNSENSMSSKNTELELTTIKSKLTMAEYKITVLEYELKVIKNDLKNLKKK